MIPPRITEARALGQQHQARGALILLFDDNGNFAGASWGRDRADCREMGHLLDEIVDALAGTTEDCVLSPPWRNRA